MFGYLISACLILTTCFALENESYEDKDIYIIIKKSLEELKDRQLAEKATNANKPTSACYDELGCFDINGTFKHLKELPEPPETVNTQFLLYTRQHLLQPQFLDYKKPETIVDSDINPKLPLIIITHGFAGSGNSSWVWEMKQAFLEKEDLNVIIIDWSLGARIPYYWQAAINTELIGAQAAVLYYVIKDKLGIQEKNVHIIGFSLGAHVAGFFSKKMQEFRGTKPGRITGLDPASPSFEDYGSDVHLYKDDADLVDVIHTNADVFYKGGLGMEKPIGHVDFYPNGGKRQPGCKNTIIGAIADIWKNNKGRSCNHERAAHLFTESILGFPACEFKGYKCSNYEEFKEAKCTSCDEQCGRLGYKSHGSGSYFLLTQTKPPYCARIAEMKAKYPSKIKSSIGVMMLTLVSKTGERENITISSTYSTDDSLKPGAEIKKATAIRMISKNIDHVEALYLKYNGLISWTSGRDTFGLESIIIKDTEGQIIYKSCNEVILKDQQYEILKPASADEDCQ